MANKTKSFLGNVLVSGITLLVMLGLLEAVFRVIGYDFNHSEAAFEATPVYYRQPTDPVGSVFFKRSGPISWTGKALTAISTQWGFGADNFPEETEKTLTWDKDGFRNPDELTDWGIIVTGDSFVELGYLDYNELFSTKLGQHLNQQVKNLGVSYSGLYTHNYFVETYAKAPSAKHCVAVFFEGNDVDDYLREVQWLNDFAKTGERPYRNLETQKQTSLLKAVYHIVRGAGAVQEYTEDKRYNALYLSGSDSIPVFLVYTPESSSTLTTEANKAIENAIQQFAEACAKNNLKPWLAYMPCKHRVLYDHLAYQSNAHKKGIKDWKPTDLPDVVADYCRASGVYFMDVTPALQAETNAGKLTFNGLVDSHVNAFGSDVVARDLARQMADQDSTLINQIP